MLVTQGAAEDGRAPVPGAGCRITRKAPWRMSKKEENSGPAPAPPARWRRRLAWALLLLWTFVWGSMGVGPWVGIAELPQDSLVVHLIPVGIGIAGGVAARRHPVAGGVYWLIAGFLLSSLLVARLQSVADVLVWCAAALPALVTGILFIVTVSPAERAALQSAARARKRGR